MATAHGFRLFKTASFYAPDSAFACYAGDTQNLPDV